MQVQAQVAVAVALAVPGQALVLAKALAQGPVPVPDLEPARHPRAPKRAPQNLRFHPRRHSPPWVQCRARQQ